MGSGELTVKDEIDKSATDRPDLDVSSRKERRRRDERKRKRRPRGRVRRSRDDANQGGPGGQGGDNRQGAPRRPHEGGGDRPRVIDKSGPAKSEPARDGVRKDKPQDKKE